MHPVLRITEVLDQIFSSFVARPIGRGDAETDSATLLALAQTCRTFWDPAVDALWAHLTTLEPLIKSMPHTISDGQCLLGAPIKPCHWDTLQKRAARVGSMSLTQKELEKSRPLNFEVFSFFPMSTSLFSNLTHLTWHESSQRPMFPFIRLFVGSPLQFLDLSLPTATVLEFTFLATLGSLFPTLKHLEVDLPDKSSSQLVGHSLLESLSCLEGLENFKCKPLPAGVLDVLRRSTRLRVLDLWLKPDSISSMSLETNIPSLHCVSLSARSLATITSFFDRLSIIHPQAIHVRADFISNDNTSRGFLGSLASHCSPEDVLEIRVRILREEQTSLFVRDRSLQISDLEPLLAFTNVTTVILDVPQGWCLNDGDLVKIATAWPKLEVLTLSRAWSWLYTMSQHLITFAGFITLLELCPLLRDLTIALDADPSSDIDLVHPGRGVFNTKIRRLHVLNSRLSKPKRVALILHGMLPRLEGVVALQNPVDGINSYGQEHIRSWDVVNEQLQIFAIVKEQLEERQRLGLDC